MRIDNNFSTQQVVMGCVLRLTLSCILGLFFGFNLHSKSVRDLSPNYIVEHWNVKDGIPGTQVLAIAQSTDGYIWIGTHYGIARFDGVKFTVFDDTTDGIPTGSCSGMLAGPNGSLWMKFGEKWVHYSRRGFSTHPNFETQFPQRGRPLCVTSSGNLILGTITDKTFETALVELSPDRVIRNVEISNPESLQMFHFDAIADGSNRIHCSFGNSVGELTDSGYVTGLNLDEKVTGIEKAGMGGIWIATDQRVIRFADNKIIGDEIPVRFTATIKRGGVHEDQNGSLWISTRDKKITRYNRFDGNRYKQAETIEIPRNTKTIIDSQNQIWFAEGILLKAEDSGLFRIRKKLFHHTKFNEKLRGNIRSFAQTSPGSILMGSSNGIFAIPIDDKLPIDWASTPVSKLIEGNYWAIAPSSSKTNSFWGGKYRISSGKSPGPSVTHLQHGEPDTPREQKGYSTEKFHRITALCEDQEGTLWVGDRSGGLFRLKDGEMTRFHSDNPRLPPEIQSLACDTQNTLWIGTSKSGLFRYRNQSLEHFKESDGCPEGQVRSIYIDQDNTVWLAFGGRGIYRYKDNAFVSFTMDEVS